MLKIAKKPEQNFIASCLLSALFPFYAFFQMTVLNALAENRIAALNISHAGLGVLSSAYLYGDALLLIPAGLILDRFNARFVILLSFMLLLFSSSVFYFTNSFYLATGSRFVAGMAHAFSLVSCFRLAALYVSHKRQGLVMSLILTIAFLGGFFAQSPFVWLLQTTGFKNASIIQTVSGVIIFFILFVTIHPPSFSVSNHSRPSHFFSGLKSAVKQSQNSIASLFVALMGVPFMTLGALYGMEYLTNNKQSNAMNASFFVSLIFIGIMTGTPVFGWLFDRVTFQKKLMMAGVVLTFISCLLLFYMQGSLWLICIAIGFFSSVQVLGYPIIAASNSNDILSTAMGFANFLIMTTIATLQWLTGCLATAFSLETGLFWMIGLACIISGICIFTLRFPQKPETPRL